MANIVYFGHSMFLIVGENGKKIVTDPFYGIKYQPPKNLFADFVVVSHDHFDHNAVDVLSGYRYKVTGDCEIEGIKFSVTLTSHGPGRGKNRVTKFSLDEISFCHLGDLGEVLSKDKVKEIGDVDVLFVPCGGFYTIGPKEALEVITRLNPKIAVPMHYGTFAEIEDIDSFKKLVDLPYFEKGHMVEVSKETLPDSCEIWELSISPQVP